MKKKVSKNKRKAPNGRRPPKAKVVSSTLAECTNLTLPKDGQVVEIPQGYVVEERIAWSGFEPKRTLFIRQSDPNLFDIYLKSRRDVNPAATRRKSQHPGAA